MIATKVVRPNLNRPYESQKQILLPSICTFELGYQFQDSDSPRQFLLSLGYRATTKLYSVEVACGMVF